jgi:hypothetical protein
LKVRKSKKKAKKVKTGRKPGKINLHDTGNLAFRLRLEGSSGNSPEFTLASHQSPKINISDRHLYPRHVSKI